MFPYVSHTCSLIKWHFMRNKVPNTGKYKRNRIALIVTEFTNELRFENN